MKEKFSFKNHANNIGKANGDEEYEEEIKNQIYWLIPLVIIITIGILLMPTNAYAIIKKNFKETVKSNKAQSTESEIAERLRGTGFKVKDYRRKPIPRQKKKIFPFPYNEGNIYKIFWDLLIRKQMIIEFKRIEKVKLFKSLELQQIISKLSNQMIKRIKYEKVPNKYKISMEKLENIGIEAFEELSNEVDPIRKIFTAANLTSKKNIKEGFLNPFNLKNYLKIGSSFYKTIKRFFKKRENKEENFKENYDYFDNFYHRLSKPEQSNFNMKLYSIIEFLICLLYKILKIFEIKYDNNSNSILDKIFLSKEKAWNIWINELVKRSGKYIVKHPVLILFLIFIFIYREQILKMLSSENLIAKFNK